MHTLRIATLNIWNKSGPYAERLRVIRQELARCQPDIVGLQEVLRLSPHRSGALDQPTPDNCQATEIAHGQGFHVAYAAASDHGNDLRFGNALLSRYPIVSSESFTLPSAGDESRRALLFAAVETPHGNLPVFVTHLSWRFNQGALRLRQVEFIVERISELVDSDGSSLPAVVMGDFNAEPDSDEIRYMRGYKVLNGKSVHFSDAWHYAGDGSPGYTFDRGNAFAAQAHEPPRRIDYIFVGGPDASFRGEPIETRLAFTVPRLTAQGPVWASDHFGLVTDLVVSRQPTQKEG